MSKTTNLMTARKSSSDTARRRSLRRAGGSATNAGTDFQNRLTAWVAVHILADQEVSPPWNLPASTVLTSLHAESAHAIDDIAVGTSAQGLILIQAKHTVTLDVGGTSALGKTVAQFVAQFCCSGRSFDPAKDAFVLATGPLSSSAVTRHLPRFLARIRSSAHPETEWTSGNQNETRAAIVLRDHLSREWSAKRATAPTAEEMLALVRLVHVHLVDVDPGGVGETEAKNLLRRTILSDPTQSDAAWSTLIAQSARYACQSQSATRPVLAQVLSAAVAGVRAPRSFQADINRLCEQTRTVLTALSDFSRITVAEKTIRITRPVISAAQTAADEGHLLIVGVPGAGKSGAVHDLADALIAAKRDVVLCAVDQLEAASLGALRAELNLAHEVAEVLNAWPGSTPAFLIIDALDAARSNQSIDTLIALINAVISTNSRWRVVASVRKFDLRYNTQLRHLFRGQPSIYFRDPEFWQIHHINIPELSDEEVAQVTGQSAEIGHLIAEAPPALADLLRIPFNLRLLADLVGAGINTAELRPIRTQPELLDLYWTERIIRHDHQGDARETLLRRTTDAMVSQRSLRVARSTVMANEATASATLHDLLSTQVLSEWQRLPGGAPQRETLTFPHHVLYDYAVARLYLPSDAVSIVSKLEDEPDLLIAIRPSIVIYGQRLWLRDQPAVWELAFAILASLRIPEVGKLLIPSVVAQCARSGAELRRLVEQLGSVNTAEKEQGLAALRYLLATLLTTASTTERFSAAPWTELLVAVTATLTLDLAYNVRPLSWWLAEHYSALTLTEQAHLGIVARRILCFVLDANDSNLLHPAITMAVRTARSAPDESVAILRACITPERLAREGYISMPALARVIPLLFPIAPAFVREVYVACFEHRETNTDATCIGDSQVLPMRSNKRQDYNGALWSLGENFTAFLQASATNAVSALVTIIDDHVTVEHRTSREEVNLPVNLEHCTSSLRPDGSVIWDNSGIGPDDAPLKLLGAFESTLLSTEHAPPSTRLVDEITAHPLSAVVWRRLLRAATHKPSSLGVRIRALAWDHTILTARDTTQPAGECIRVLFPLLSAAERERVESAIMAIPGNAASNVGFAERQRDRLLGCIDPGQLVTTDAVRHRATLDQAKGPPPNPPEFRITFGALPLDPLLHLRDEGVEIEATETQTMLALLEPVGRFASEHLHNVPNDDQITAFLPALAVVAKALAAAVPPASLENHLLGDMAEAASRALTSDTYRWDETDLSMIRTFLLRAINLPAESTDEERERQFAKSPGWGMPNARVSAAGGLLLLGRQASVMDTELVDRISALVADTDVIVRYQAAVHLNCVSLTAPALVWAALEDIFQHEGNQSVLNAALNPLRIIGQTDLAKVASLVEGLFERTFDRQDEHEKVYINCAKILMDLALWREEKRGLAFVERLIASPCQYHHVLRHIAFNLAMGLCSEQPGIAAKAFRYLDRMLDGFLVASRTIETDQGTLQNPWPQEVQDVYTGLLNGVDQIALRLCIDAGAHGHGLANDETVDPVVDARRCAFYPQARPLLEKLAAVGHPHTAQYTMELLAFLSPVDPSGILLLVAALIRVAATRGYQYDQLAGPLVVGYVERFLAENRTVLRERPECNRALVDILDVFVRVGWPSAHRLVYRLDEIYR